MPLKCQYNKGVLQKDYFLNKKDWNKKEFIKKM